MLSDGEISYLYDGFGRFEQVTKADGSITHVINGEEKESGELPQEDVQSRVLNHYEYDAFGNTIRCEEQVHNRFRYTGEQYDILTGQYYRGQDIITLSLPDLHRKTLITGMD